MGEFVVLRLPLKNDKLHIKSHRWLHSLNNQKTMRSTLLITDKVRVSVSHFMSVIKNSSTIFRMKDFLLIGDQRETASALITDELRYVKTVLNIFASSHAYLQSSSSLHSPIFSR